MNMALHSIFKKARDLFRDCLGEAPAAPPVMRAPRRNRNRFRRVMQKTVIRVFQYRHRHRR